MTEPALLSARGLRKQYGTGEALVRAVDDVDIDVARGEMLLTPDQIESAREVRELTKLDMAK